MDKSWKKSNCSPSFDVYKLQNKLAALKNERSKDGSTCLVSLYIPGNKSLAAVRSELNKELALAARIRLKSTRKNVLTALKLLLNKLELAGTRSPENGLVLFSGVTSNKPECFVISPPNPVGRKTYACDSFFHVDELQECLEGKDAYGAILISAARSVIAVIKNEQFIILKTLKSGVKNKSKAGGQSSVRFARLREETIHRFMTKVADEAREQFISRRIYNIKGLIIGGSGLAKERFTRGNYLDTQLKSILLKITDIEQPPGKEGLNELVNRSREVFKGIRLIKEKELVQQWQEHLLMDTGLAAYGEQETREFLKRGAVDTLLLSKDLPEQQLIRDSGNLVIELGNLASEKRTRVEIISGFTEEGQILRSFGGIGAILRYKPQ